MNNLDCLVEVMAAETDLAEKLAEVLEQQQRFLISSDAEGVARTAEQQQELLLPLEGLEQERERRTRELWDAVAAEPLPDNRPVSLSTLIQHLGANDARRVSDVGNRLQAAVESLVRLNHANQFLIEHSRRFVRESLRILTNDYARQLVDRKM